MYKKTKPAVAQRLTAVLLSLLMLITIVPLGSVPVYAEEPTGKTITEYNTGDIVEFGWYPQSEVADDALKDTLTSLAGNTDTWTSYGYYSGTGSYSDGKMTASDYMVYKDVVYDNSKYRGVYFTKYRPYCTGYTESSTHQDDNGYSKNTIYWFKYDPIEWRVLDPTTGLVMSETILDSQAYNNYILHEDVADPYHSDTCWGNSSKTYYANNYEYSSIRAWLNEDFYNTAFSTEQQKAIATTTLDNSAYDTSYSAYSANSTNDKIFLLSWSDISNTNYGFSSKQNQNDTSRQAKGSAYAKSQGLDVYTTNEYSYWHLRSAGHYSAYPCYVRRGGEAYYFSKTYYTDLGVRPALCFNLSSSIIQYPVVCTHAWDAGEITTAATCNATGVKTYTCTVCKETKTEIIAKNPDNHTGGTEIRNAKTAACGTVGYTGDTYCLGCGVKIAAGTTIPATGAHTWDAGTVTKTAACNATGTKKFTCTVCKATKTETIAKNPDNHTGGTEIRNARAAVCGTAGYTGDTYCLGCGVKIADGTAIPANGEHTWDAGTVTTAPTCTAQGEMTFTCTGCGATKTAAIAVDLYAHQWSGYRTVKEETETEDGLKERTCALCKKTESMAFSSKKVRLTYDTDTNILSLNFVNAVGLKDWDLTVSYDTAAFDGVISSDAGTDAVKVNNTKSNSLDILQGINTETDGTILFSGYFKESLWTAEQFLADAKKGKDASVNASDFNAVLFGMHLKNGFSLDDKDTTVTVTGVFKTDSDEQIEVSASLVIHKHSYGDGVIIKAANCHEKGITTYTCSRCGDVRTETTETDPDRHDGGTRIADEVIATYTTDGYTGNTYCLGCGAKLAEGTVIPALIKYGDIDGNGTVTASDARLVLRASVRLETLTERQTKAADVDGDGQVTAADARLILRYSVKLETIFPAEA